MSSAATEASSSDPLDVLDADRRRIVGRFVRDGRIAQIPAKRSVRRVLLEWLVLDFQPDRAYTEAMVNLVIGQRHADVAALRRYLVDEGLMARAGGSYRRLPQ